MATTKKKSAKPKITCNNCKKEKSVDLFFRSNSPKHEINGGYCPYCKRCLNKIAIVNGELDKEKLKFILKEYMDKPFFEGVFEKIISVPSKNKLGTYLKQLNLRGGRGKILGWKDGDFEDKKEEERKKNIVEIPVYDQSKLYTIEQLFKLQNKWGEGLEPKDYKYLEEQFLDLGKHYKSEDSYAMQLIFEEACLTRLTIKKKREKGEDVNKELKTLQDLLGSANIKPNQETNSENIEKGSFGMFLKKIEDEEPIPDWERDLGKKDVMKKYIRIFFFGNLAKVLNIANPWLDEYEEKMKEYTVSKVDNDNEGKD